MVGTSKTALALTFTPEQQEALKGAGFDWKKLLQLLQNPMVKQIILQFIEILLTPTPAPVPQPVFGAAAPTLKGHGDHKALCKATLQACCTACCIASAHYEACCEAEENHDH